MNQTFQEDLNGVIAQYQQRVASLENELEEMTIALSHAWDQLVPFLQESSTQTDTDPITDFTMVIHAANAAAEAHFGAIYFFDGMWISVPEAMKISEERKQFLRDHLSTDGSLQWEEYLPQEGLMLQWVFVPIVVDQRIVGAIGIGNHNGRLFTSLDLRILARMAERAANQMVATELALSRQREAASAREMQIASMIQRSIQPKYTPKHSAMRIASYWQPAKRVGGDAWGWMQEPDGRVSWFVLDVAGKGLPAALAAMSLHTALSMGLRIGLPQADLLTIINEQFYDSFSDTDLMATMSLVSLDPRSGILKQVNAGHLPTLIRKGSEWVSLPATVPPLGVLPNLKADTQVISLEIQDLVVTYSDGYTEIETEHGLWGETGLTSAILTGEIEPAAAVQAINTAADQVALTSEQHDDRTLIIANLI